MSDEQRVRTMAGWIGVEISRSRVRTPGRAGYGLYRVRGSVGRTWRETRELPRSAVTEDLHGERGPWTAYAFTLADIERAVSGAILAGNPARPGSLRVRQEFPGKEAAIAPTRWTSAYQGRRDLGVPPEGAEPPAFGATFTVPCEDESEPDGEICTGVVHYGPSDTQQRCTVCGGWRGRLAPLSVRQRQRAQNAAFQAEHLVAREHGLKQRHAAKLGRIAARGDGDEVR